MDAPLDPTFVEKYGRYYVKMLKLDVPIEAWRDVLVEMYFPVDWRDLPRAFKMLASDLDSSEEHRAIYDLHRPDGMSDADFARGLLRRAQEKVDALREMITRDDESSFERRILNPPPQSEFDVDIAAVDEFWKRHKLN